MRKYYLLAALALSLALPATARAVGPFGFGPQKTDQYGFHKPIFGPRAAPWFVYWPYSAYFNTPAPTGAAFAPEAMTPGGFQPHMYNGMGPGHGFAPYPTNGYGQ